MTPDRIAPRRIAGHRIALVVAVSENGVIGKDGDLPWRLPDELKFFKRLTVGHTLIMGRRTFESIGRPLPRRRNLVLSRDPSYRAEGIEVFPDLDAAFATCAPQDEAESPDLFVVGGATVYEQSLPLAGHLFLTRVHTKIDGDTRFPDVDWSLWNRVSSEPHPADTKHAHSFTMEHYVRRLDA